MGRQMSFTTDSMNRKKFKERIFLVSVKNDSFYDLTDLVPEAMEEENLSEEEIMNYFMRVLKGTAWRKFKKGTETSEITKWILNIER